MSELKDFYISPSQAETFDAEDGCNRKWAFDKVFRLPRIERAATDFGSVTHEVVERFLEGDDTGRVDGKPVTLYPPGWESNLKPHEQNLVKFLFKLAVRYGVIERWPGRRIEHEFKEELIPEYRGYKVWVVGLIDVLLQSMIIDHKTTKRKTYCKSKNKLRKNLQLLTYAMIPLLEAERKGSVAPEKIGIRHNYFIKIPDEKKVSAEAWEKLLLGQSDVLPAQSTEFVRSVENTVSQEEIIENWSRLMRISQEMIDLKLWIREKKPKWDEVPGPEDLSKSCNAYGGCTYRSICGRTESIERYTNRVSAINRAAAKDTTLKQQQGAGAVSSFKDKMAKIKARKAAETTSGVSGVKKPPEEKPEIPETLKEDFDPPPWAIEDCKACEGSGFNSKGGVCRMCSMKSPAKPLWFEFERLDDGSVVWEVKAEHAAQWDELNGDAQEEIEEPEVEEEPSPKKKASRKKKPLAATKQQEQEEKPSTPGKRTGRKKKGFTLLVNCWPSRIGPGISTISIHDILKDAGEELVQAMGVDDDDGYYDLDAFKRRDRLASVAEKIADDLGTSVVVADGNSPDVRALVDALHPYAYLVISAS